MNAQKHIFIFLLIITEISTCITAYSAKKINQLSPGNHVNENIIDSLFFSAQESLKAKDFISSLEIYMKIQFFLEKENNSGQLDKLYLNLGDLYQKWGIYLKAIEYYKKLSSKTRNDVTINKNFAFAWEMLNNTDSAIFYLDLCRKSYHETNNIVAGSVIINKMANHFSSQQKYRKALSAYIELLSMAKQMNDTANIIKTCNNIGIIHKHTGDYDSAIKYMTESLDYYNNYNRKTFDLFSVMINIGVLYQLRSQYSQSYSFLNNALKLANENGNDNQKCIADNYIAAMYVSTGELKKAAAYAKNNRSFAQNHAVDKGIRAQTFKLLSDIYKKNGDFEKALSCFIEYNSLANEIHKEEQAAKIKNLEKQYIVLNKEKEILQLLTDKEINVLELTKLKLELIRQAQANKLIINEKKLKQAEIEKYKLEKQKALKDLQLTEITCLNRQQSNEIEILEKDKKVKALELKRNELEKQKVERELTVLSQKNKIATLYRNLLLVVAIGLLVSGWLVISRHQLKIKKNKEIIAQNQKLHQAEVKKIESEQKHIKTELEQKQKQLTTFTLQFVQRSNVLLEIKEKLNDLFSTDSRINKKLNQLLLIINQNLNQDKDWETFKLYFEQVNTGFFKNLLQKFPALTSGDLKQLALCRLNLSMKEAAAITNSTTNSIKIARFRLRKKIGIDDDNSLINFALNFE